MDTVGDMFSYRSELRKEIDERIRSTLHIDTSVIDLSKYATTITSLITSTIDERMDIEARKQVDRIVSNIQGDIPSSIKLSEIVQKIIERFIEEEYSDKVPGEEVEFTCILKQKFPNSDLLSELWQLNLDPRSGQEARNCCISIDIRKADPKYGRDKTQITDVTYRQMPMSGNARLYTTRNWSLEGYLFALYSAAPEIILDEKDLPEYFTIPDENED